jgi:hypothetical protein
MIKIFLLVLLFLLIVYFQRQKEEKEGLMNQYDPIDVSTDGSSNIYEDKLTNPSDSLYEPKYTEMDKNDVLLDMKYFNNATNIIFAYQAKNFGV